MVYKLETTEGKEQKYVTVIQFARMMGVTRAAIYKQIHANKIRVEYVGGHVFIPMEEATSVSRRRLTNKRKKQIDTGVKKVVKEYGDTLKLLGKE